MDSLTTTAGCGGTPAAPRHRAAGRTALAGFGLLAGACGLTCLAPALGVLLWPLAAAAAGLGAYRLVTARGCGTTGNAAPGDTAPTEAAAVLPAPARRARAMAGLVMLAGAAGLLAIAASGRAIAWPPAAVAAWFGVSFLVAAATGYPGCPEIGAIASLVRRRPLATACPPLARADARVRRRC
jgi:hypothetical protein